MADVWTINEMAKSADLSQPLWEPFFKTKGVCVFAGGSDSNKSMTLIQFCMSLLTERTFLGYPIHPRHKRFLYVATEDDETQIIQRLNRMAYAGLVPAWSVNEPLFMFSEYNIFERIEEHLSKYKVDVVVLDTYMDVLSANTQGTASNSADMTSRFLSKIKMLADSYDTLFIICHHTRKGQESMMPHKDSVMGSQRLEAKARMVMHLRRVEDYLYLSVLKCNYLPNEMKQVSQVLEFDPGTFTVSHTGKEVPIDFAATDDESVSRKKEDLRKVCSQKLLEGKTHQEVADEMLVPLKTLYRWFPRTETKVERKEDVEDGKV